MAEIDPQALFDTATFLMGVATGGLLTSALALGYALATRPREEAPTDANRG